MRLTSVFLYTIPWVTLHSPPVAQNKFSHGVRPSPQTRYVMQGQQHTFSRNGMTSGFCGLTTVWLISSPRAADWTLLSATMGAGDGGCRDRDGREAAGACVPAQMLSSPRRGTKTGLATVAGPDVTPRVCYAPRRAIGLGQRGEIEID